MLTSILLFPLNIRPPNTNSAANRIITKITNTATTPVLLLLLSAIYSPPVSSNSSQESVNSQLFRHLTTLELLLSRNWNQRQGAKQTNAVIYFRLFFRLCVTTYASPL